MAYKRNRTIKSILDYCLSCGVEIHTTTKARGHQGIFLHDNNRLKRIDISNNLPDEKMLRVIVHEFAHFFHHNIDSNFESLDKIFGIKNEILLDELKLVTAFVSGNTVELSIVQEINKIKSELIKYELIIKESFPDFKRSKKFKEFERYIKKSDARFLLKYDCVKVVNGLKSAIYSIDNLEKDFPFMPKEFAAYINLRALQRKQRRYSSKLHKLKVYYSKPAELFARFVEGLVVDKTKVQELAPEAFAAFEERINYHAFKDLRGMLEIISQ